MFRIDHTANALRPTPSRTSAPPPPSGASEPAELKRALATLSTELREQVAQVHRLRLVVRLREDAIRELEAALRQQRERVDALEKELTNSQVERDADDLKRVSGIGPGFERALHALGVTSFRQIAEWSPDELERIAREIRTTPRRILRDRWVEHARALVAEQAAAES